MEIRNGVFCFNLRNLEISFLGLLGDWASHVTADELFLKMLP